MYRSASDVDKDNRLRAQRMCFQNESECRRDLHAARFPQPRASIDSKIHHAKRPDIFPAACAGIPAMPDPREERAPNPLRLRRRWHHTASYMEAGAIGLLPQLSGLPSDRYDV